MLDQKRKWIAVLIGCASDSSVLVEKFKLNWFNLKKFIGKKMVALTIKSYQRPAVVLAKR